jgi:hypothetical protein
MSLLALSESLALAMTRFVRDRFCRTIARFSSGPTTRSYVGGAPVAGGVAFYERLARETAYWRREARNGLIAYRSLFRQSLRRFALKRKRRPSLSSKLTLTSSLWQAAAMMRSGLRRRLDELIVARRPRRPKLHHLSSIPMQTVESCCSVRPRRAHLFRRMAITTKPTRHSAKPLGERSRGCWASENNMHLKRITKGP